MVSGRTPVTLLPLKSTWLRYLSAAMKKHIPLVLVCAYCVAACSSEEPPAESIRPVVSIKVADVAKFSESTFPGRAKAVDEADLAFEVSGKLVERPVDVGSVVEEGQLLAQLALGLVLHERLQRRVVQGERPAVLRRVRVVVETRHRPAPYQTPPATAAPRSQRSPSMPAEGNAARSSRRRNRGGTRSLQSSRM